MIRRRVIAGAAGIALLMGVGAVPPAQQTDAYFTDTEYISASTFTAGTMTPLTGATCTLLPGLTFTGVRLVWQSAYDIDGVPEPGYSPVSGTGTNGSTTYLDRSVIVKTGPTGGLYTYTATMNVALLSGLLGTLLGATTTLTIQERYPIAGSLWKTPAKSFRLTVALGGLLGLGTSCTAI